VRGYLDLSQLLEMVRGYSNLFWPLKVLWFYLHLFRLLKVQWDVHKVDPNFQQTFHPIAV
jgi:hypothetical protein